MNVWVVLNRLIFAYCSASHKRKGAIMNPEIYFGIFECWPFGYFHDLAVTNKMRPNISSLPSNMVMVKTHLPTSGI